MDKNSTSEIIQVFRGILESLLRMNQTKLKKVMFKKDKKGKNKFNKELSKIIEQALKKNFLNEKFTKFFENIKKFSFPEHTSQYLEKIMKILIPKNEEKLKMIYRVIKIITLINQPTELSSFISSTVSNSSDFLSTPQHIPDTQNIGNNNEKNIKDFVSIKSFDSEKQSKIKKFYLFLDVQNLLKLEELKNYAKSRKNKDERLIKNKRKRQDPKKRNSIISEDRLSKSIPSNLTNNSEEFSSGISSELKFNFVNKTNNIFFANDIKKNSHNLYSIDKCLVPFQPEVQVKKSVNLNNVNEGKKEIPQTQKKIFNFTEYNSSSDIEPMCVISQIKEKDSVNQHRNNFDYKSSDININTNNSNISNKQLYQNQEKSQNKQKNNKQNSMPDIVYQHIDGADSNKSNNINRNMINNNIRSRQLDQNHDQNQYLQDNNKLNYMNTVNCSNIASNFKQIEVKSNTNDIFSFQTQNYFENNGPLTNSSVISRNSKKISNFIDDEVDNQQNVSFKSPPSIYKSQLKEKFEKTAQLLKLKIPPPIVVTKKKN